MIKKCGKYFAGIIVLIFLTSFSASADVSVYAEGAYTDSDLVVYIYADVDTNPIVSYGVKLEYNSSVLALKTDTGIEDLTEPGDIDTDGVIKNYVDWYFGDASPGYDTPNANPVTSSPGEVVIVGGKIKTSAPAEGVLDSRVLLAKIFFTRTGDEAFGINLLLAKGGDYANFVQVDGELLDDNTPSDTPAFAIGAAIIRERGDANGDGHVTPADMIAVRNAYYGGAPLICEPAADCNNDSSDLLPNVTPADMICIRNKYYNP